jgi:hypothetical protein
VFPKRGQVWSYRDRGRFLALIWGIPLIPLLGIGVYFVASESNWGILLITLLAIVGWALYFFSSERSHRGEP